METESGSESDIGADHPRRRRERRRAVALEPSESDDSAGEESESDGDSSSDGSSDEEGLSEEDDEEEVELVPSRRQPKPGARKRLPDARAQPRLSMRGRHTPPPPMEIVAAKRQKVAPIKLASPQKVEEEITPPAGNVSSSAQRYERGSGRGSRQPARGRGGRGRGRGQGRGRRGSGSTDRGRPPQKQTVPADSDDPSGRRTSGRDRAPPVAFWTLDGLSRCAEPSWRRTTLRTMLTPPCCAGAWRGQKRL